MARKYYMPQTAEGIDQVLMSFDTNINAHAGALAAKYGVDAGDLVRITQARLVWGWFMEALTAARSWARSLTQTRDMMQTAPQNGSQPLPGGPMLPPVPQLPGTDPGPAELEPGFFSFFIALVAQIKNDEAYDISDGQLLGVEGTEVPPPNSATTVPELEGDLFTSGQPELTCKKGPFQGYEVFLTRPGQARRSIGFSTSRRFLVTEPLPAPGTAEVWTFEAQYRYQNAPFGRVSQPLVMTVRG